MIDGQGTAAIAAGVSLATELIKALLATEDPDAAKRAGPYIALCVSLLFTVAYILSMPVLPGRMDIWSLTMGLVTVYGTATGFYTGTKLAAKTVRRAAPKKDSAKDDAS